MPKKPAPRRMWTDLEVALLRAEYATTTNALLAQALGRPVERVAAKAYSLGLRKSREFIVALARERTEKPDHPSRAYRWTKGAPPWNKGQPGTTGHHPKTRAAQFKPGNRPHTWVPVGSFRIKDGHLEIKYSDDTGSTSKRWRLYAAHVWIAANGPVPAGHLVVFKPGRATQDPAAITLDAVELITRREIMQRNTCHRLPKELARVVQLRGVLTRAINEREKEATSS